MAHGSPDNVQSTDINLTGYVDTIYVDAQSTILAGATKDYVDLAGYGSLGLVTFRVTDENAKLRVYLDGIEIMYLSINTYFKNNGLDPMGGGGLYGVSMYDQVNNEFALWYNPKYQIVFYKSLKVSLQNPTGSDIIAYVFRVFYKERP